MLLRCEDRAAILLPSTLVVDVSARMYRSDTSRDEH
jgi:hypothetical protein